MHSKSLLATLPLLLSLVWLSGCGSDNQNDDAATGSANESAVAEPKLADNEIIVLCYYYEQAPQLPLAEAIAATTERGVADESGAKVVEVELGARKYKLVDYGTHEAVMDRLTKQPAPAGAVLIISGMYGSFDQHKEQLEQIKTTGTPLLVTVYDEVSKIDDAELLDLEQMAIEEMIAQTGHEGAQVVRTDTALVVEGDEEAANRFQAAVDAMAKRMANE